LPGLVRCPRGPDNPDVVAPGDSFGTPQDRLRASDAERDLVIGELSDRFAEGRLSHDTFAARLDAAMHARARGELRTLVADLPRSRHIGAAVRAAVVGCFRRAVQAVDRWTRKPPVPLTLPAGEQPRFTIGREPACDMTLADMSVSRWHASLNREGDGWLLTDLGSTNGTRLNGWRVKEPTAVLPGDLVSFGAATFVLQDRPGLAGIAAAGQCRY
jgi:hypothetical protein